MKTVKILDKKFELSIPGNEIQFKIESLAEQINEDLRDKAVVFIVILNGAFMFASDLYKRITLDSRISFLKLASYAGASSTGNVKQLVGLNESIKNKTIVVIEDIVDSGQTMDSILKQLEGFEPAEIKIATLLHKPDAYKFEHKIDYIGFNIPNDFIIGYGLDYEGFGRNLESIYSVRD